MAARNAGVSGIAVTAAAFGIFAAYAGIRDVPVLEGLRAVLRGEDPSSLSRSSGAGYAGPVGAGSSSSTASSAGGATFTGPVSIGQTTVVTVGPVTGGIRVNKAIADNVRSLIVAAAAAGVRLEGSGWRSTSTQRALRLAHGYPSDSTPSGSGGRLPVARPGTSRHEAGLAIDFRVGNRSVRRSDAAFRWLEANAAKYGLRNLPSEPWHWSVDGK